MSNHVDLVEGDIHIVHNYEYADESTMAAASGFVAADIGKVAHAISENTWHLLTAVTPTWVQLGDGVGASGLGDLSDVTLGTPADGDALVYNYAGGYWEEGTPDMEINDLNNVQGTPADGEVLTYNYGGGYWEPVAAAASDIHDTDDAVTNAVTDVVTLQHNTSGTPAAGFGTGIEFEAETTTTEDTLMGSFGMRWANATHANRRSEFVFYTNTYGTANEAGVISSPLAGYGTAGNLRGDGSVDLQTTRSAATQIAYGPFSAMVGGLYSTAYGTSSFVIGGGSGIASGRYSGLVGGLKGKADKNNQIVVSNGAWGAAQTGEAQGTIGMVGARSITHSDGNWYDIYLGQTGAEQRIPIASDTAWCFDVLIVGTTTGMGKTFAYRIEGIIENDGGTTSILAQTTTDIYEADDVSFDAQVAADDANDALQIQVQDAGGAGDTVRWVFNLRMAEVTFA